MPGNGGILTLHNLVTLSYIYVFNRGLEAEKITGASFETGKIFFSVKWKDSDVTDIVSGKDANLMIPQLVIQFYQERVDWGQEEEEEVLAKQKDQHQDLPPDLPPELPDTATLSVTS